MGRGLFTGGGGLGLGCGEATSLFGTGLLGDGVGDGCAFGGGGGDGEGSGGGGGGLASNGDTGGLPSATSSSSCVWISIMTRIGGAGGVSDSGGANGNNVSLSACGTRISTAPGASATTGPFATGGTSSTNALTSSGNDGK